MCRWVPFSFDSRWQWAQPELDTVTKRPIVVSLARARQDLARDWEDVARRSITVGGEVGAATAKLGAEVEDELEPFDWCPMVQKIDQKINLFRHMMDKCSHIVTVGPNNTSLVCKSYIVVPFSRS